MDSSQSKLILSLVTPERRILQEEVEEVVLPGTEGYLGVLPGHTPLLTSLRPGELSYRKAGSWRRSFVAWGFAEILPGGVSVLADVGELAEEIDVSRAEAARDRAQKRLKSPSQDLDWDRARVALDRALARLQVSGRK